MGNLKLCLLRLGALFTDLAFLALVLFVVLDPALAIFNFIVVGFLGNSDFLSRLLVTALVGYLFLAVAVTAIFLYNCFRLRSYSWRQGTVGKRFAGLVRTFRRNKFTNAFACVFAAFWCCLCCLTTVAFVVLPLTMYRTTQVLRAHDLDSLNEFKRKTLFTRLDLPFFWIAQNDNIYAELRRQSLLVASDLQPQRHTYWYWRAQNHIVDGVYLDALAAITKAIRNYDPEENAFKVRSFVGNVVLRDHSYKSASESSLYSLRATIHQKLGSDQSAFDDFSKAYSLGGTDEDYRNWLALSKKLEAQKASAAASRLAQVTLSANAAYKTLLKYPAAFQKRKDLYNAVIDLNNAGVRFIALNQIDAAIEKLSAAVKLGDELRAKKSTLKNNGTEFENAYEKWQSALDLERECDLSKRNLSIAYDRKATATNDLQTGLSYLKSALHFDPLNEPAQAHYKDLLAKLDHQPRLK